jgi:hypothetical protein
MDGLLKLQIRIESVVVLDYSTPGSYIVTARYHLPRASRRDAPVGRLFETNVKLLGK